MTVADLEALKSARMNITMVQRRVDPIKQTNLYNALATCEEQLSYAMRMISAEVNADVQELEERAKSHLGPRKPMEPASRNIKHRFEVRGDEKVCHWCRLPMASSVHHYNEMDRKTASTGERETD